MNNHTNEYALCAQISKRCSCQERKQMPCSAIIEMVENGQTARAEKRRMTMERNASGQEWEVL